MKTYDLHFAIAEALIEEGLEAYAFRRSIDVIDNIVIRHSKDPRRKAEVYTAFVEEDGICIGKSDLYVRKIFNIANPNCFSQIKEWLSTYKEHENPCRLVTQFPRDDRCKLGDMLENWIANTPRFYLGITAERIYQSKIRGLGSLY